MTLNQKKAGTVLTNHATDRPRKSAFANRTESRLELNLLNGGEMAQIRLNTFGVDNVDAPTQMTNAPEITDAATELKRELKDHLVAKTNVENCGAVIASPFGTLKWFRQPPAEKMVMLKNMFFVSSVVLISVFWSLPTALGNTIDLNDIYCNCLTSGSTAGGTVTVTQVGNEAQMVITLGSGLDFYKNNTFDLFALSYAGSFSSTLASGSTPGLSLSTTPVSSGSMGSAGTFFELFVDCASCSSGDTGINSMTLVLQSPLSLAASDFETFLGLGGRSNNVDFAAAVTRTGVTSGCGVVGGGHGNLDSAAIASDGSGIGGSGCTSGLVPEPASFELLAFGVVGLALKVVKKKGTAA